MKGIGCIVLAAGYSRRYGSDKRLAPVTGNQTLLDLTLASVPSLFDSYLLVLHPGDEALAGAHAVRWQAIAARDAQLGIAHSLGAALPFAQHWAAAVIILADMPLVQAATYAAICRTLASDRIVVPCYRGQRGNPVGIGADFFGELAALSGDQGARQLLGRHADRVMRLELDDPGILRDVDTPQELGLLNGVTEQR